jgi:putative DNA primase/helicase
LNQKGFTQSEVIDQRNKQYRKETDSVLMFIDDRDYETDYENPTTLAELYTKYKRFCEGDAYHPVSKRKFSKRLEKANYKKKRIAAGVAFCISKAKK